MIVKNLKVKNLLNRSMSNFDYNNFCSEESCHEKGTIDSHVVNADSSDKNRYIVPLCSYHCLSDEPIDIGNTMPHRFNGSTVLKKQKVRV